MKKTLTLTIRCLGIFLITEAIVSTAFGSDVKLGGEVGDAAAASAARFRAAPYDSIPWLRADLTGETATEFDEADWGHVMKRPFKNYSGDITGRFIEVMAMDCSGDPDIHPGFKEILEAVHQQQRSGGYFCASGIIDWQQPIDGIKKGNNSMKSIMLPALWGNARLLCGLVETMRAFPDDTDSADAARKLGDFYISMLPRFNDPNRIDEYTLGGSYAAGYVTCWFPAMEGLVKLGTFTGEKKYIYAAEDIAEFYRHFDHIPVDHAHGMLCCQVSLLLLYETTGKADYLSQVEKRWDELVEGGYINPAGGILEKCRVQFKRDEGCAIVDWLRLNLALGQVTGNVRYWAMAERTLHNHFLQNQCLNGGFGHRDVLSDSDGAYGFRPKNEESTWCCTFHGELGFTVLREHLLSRADNALTCNFALDFDATDSRGTTTSALSSSQKTGEILRQQILLTEQPATVVRVRWPHWADGVTAVDSKGKMIHLEIKDGWCATKKPVSEVEFIYSGGVYVEDRRCQRLDEPPANDKPYVIGYGPKLLAAEECSSSLPAWPTTIKDLKKNGWEPLRPELRDKTCCFVVGLRE